MKSSGEAYTSDDIAKALEEAGEVVEPGTTVEISEKKRFSNTTRRHYDRDKFKDHYPELPPSERPIFNGGDETELPAYFAKNYKREKYEHRIIAYLKAQGHSNTEIAAITGYSRTTLYQIFQLPWVKEVVWEEINRNGRDAVQEVLQSSAIDSVNFLIETRDDSKAQRRDRITAAKELLDRTYGKPNQPITHRDEVDLSSLSDSDLQKILAGGPSCN